jgi:Fe-S-cluster containining protein
MNQHLSLIKRCVPCRAKCCKAGDRIGSPILDYEERTRAEEIMRGSTREVALPSGQKYYLINEAEGSRLCSLLREDNTCLIQKIKPLDCLCYPIKAVYGDDHAVRLVIDADCPAAQHINDLFVSVAKDAAMKSIRRFDEATYNHWLDNYVGWAKNGNALDLDKFLGSNAR